MPKVSFTDEELSRVLSEHSIGGMARLGGDWLAGEKVCILQVKLNIFSSEDAANTAPNLAWVFDEEYKENSSPEELLSSIDKWSNNVS